MALADKHLTFLTIDTTGACDLTCREMCYYNPQIDISKPSVRVAAIKQAVADAARELNLKTLVLAGKPDLYIVTTQSGTLSKEGLDDWHKQITEYMTSGEMQFPFAVWRDLNRDGFEDLALVFASKSTINNWGWRKWCDLPPFCGPIIM